MVGNPLMASGRFEPEETACVRELLQEVDVLVNVGANIGYYCCHALSLGKRVIAFEPIQRNLRYLYRNVKLNGWSDIEIFPVALSDRAGIVDIYGGDTGASVLPGWAGTPESYVSLVPALTLDGVLSGRLAGAKVLVLVDIEGAEKWMLDGATGLLANEPRPIWMIEVMAAMTRGDRQEPNPHFAGVFEIFWKHGYTAVSADSARREVTPAQVEAIARGAGLPPGHNFVFR